ncbi:MAG: AraC family transcriptional regulator [Lachnospiraceae bacterium]|nr:AraC family transcriptional regulator [Lachnospiraceae bacterium]
MREYIRYFTQERSDPFIIEISGKSWCDGSYRIFRDKPRMWVLEFIVSGTGTVHSDPENLDYHPRAGDVYLLPPNQRHLYFSDADDPWVKLFLNMRGPVIDGLADAYGLSHRIHFPDMLELQSLFEEIYGMMEDRQLPDTLILERTELLVHRIFRSLGEKYRSKNRASEEMEKVKQYLDTHVGQIVTIQALSDLIYRSPDYLIKHFKAEFGMTPYQYLLNRKMVIAERLLRDTTLPVKEVAEQLGYEDAHYFSGLFKKERKVSPSQFRKGK